MPKFRVKGCLKENAEDVEVIIEASSYKDAERIANQKGILVSDVLTVEETAQKQHEPNVTLTAPPESKKKSKVKTIVIISIAAIFLFSCMLSTLIPAIGRATSDSKGSNRSTQKAPTVDYGSAQGAWAYMQQFVSDRLKSPKSAEYASFYDSTVTSLGGGRYRVQSYVDATNSFGGEIRTPFIGIIKRITIDGESGWELESLNLN